MAGFVFFCLILLVAALSVGAAFHLLQWLHGRWRVTGREHAGRRMAIVLAGALAVCSPYLLYKAGELWFVLSRVPAPLHVAWIEYRREDCGGCLGLPGDNEHGFIVYRLTGGSAAWARDQGPRLGALLPGGAAEWRPTPVDEGEPHDRWHEAGWWHEATEVCHPASIREYLAAYGGELPLEPGGDADVDHAIRHPGSFYRYTPGGAVTIVDPARGKIYFAYAG